MSNVEALLDTEARNQVQSDALVEANLQTISERVQELLRAPEERNPGIWALFEVANPGAILYDYSAVEVKDRDLAWVNEMAAMFAAAQHQATIEIAGADFIAMWERHGEEIQAITQAMSRSELQQAAKQGVGKARREAQNG